MRCVEPHCLGVIPTPGVAYLTVNTHADAGIVISASHNPFEHNGIKMFSAEGFKLSDALEEEIEDLEDTLKKPARIRKIIVSELEDVRKKYAEPRRTGILYDYAEDVDAEEDAIEDYPVTLFLSQQGYFKKITPQSLRMSGEQKFKKKKSI